MTLPAEARTFAGRLTSFERPVHLAKRRASSSTSTRKRNATTVSWPHKFLDPIDLARAGFYYKPTASEHDNVTCFLCQKSLAGWEKGDNAAQEHLVHSPDCAWAIYACISQRSDEHTRDEEAPSDERLVEARLTTFQDSWPHQSKRGWKCKTKKMVEAGWCYDPSPECDDGVTCFYCNVSLDGWEPKDDPWEEHKKRSPDCYFFILVGTKKKAGSKKGRSSQASKTSLLSRQSSLTAFSEAPSMMSLGDVEPIDGDSMLTTATNATNTTVTSMKGEGRKGRPKGKTGPKNKRQIRGKPSAKDVESKPVAEEPNVLSMDTDEETAPRQPAKRTRKKAAESIGDSQIESVISAKPQPAKKPGRKKKAEDITLPEPESELEHRISEDASQLVSELMDATDPAEVPPAQLNRGTKRTSDGMPKAESSLVMLDEAPSQINSQEKQPKRGKKGAKQMAITSEETAVAEPSSMIEQSISSQTTTAPKAKRGRKPKQTKQQEESRMSATHTPFSQPSDPPPPPPPPPPPELKSPRQSHHEAEEKAIPEPQQSLQAATPKRLSYNTPAKAITPSPSPQSSDAENKPPSSRPSIPLSQQRPAFVPSSPSRTPLAPTTPVRSPTKRSNHNNNIINGGLATTHPWQTVDLETIFLPSPHSKAMRMADSDNKENLPLALATIDTQENRPLEQVVKEVKARMTSPEKQMNVEEWISFNAKQGESKMRDECERLVSIFETEGGKAMRALEGIECMQ